MQGVRSGNRSPAGPLLPVLLGVIVAVAILPAFAHAETYTITVNDEEFEITYDVIGISVTGFDFDREANALIIHVNATSDGALEITFDMEMFHTTGEDPVVEFSVMVDGEEGLTASDPDTPYEMRIIVPAESNEVNIYGKKISSMGAVQSTSSSTTIQNTEPEATGTEQPEGNGSGDAAETGGEPENGGTQQPVDDGSGDAAETGGEPETDNAGQPDDSGDAAETGGEPENGGTQQPVDDGSGDAAETGGEPETDNAGQPDDSGDAAETGGEPENGGTQQPVDDGSGDAAETGGEPETDNAGQPDDSGDAAAVTVNAGTINIGQGNDQTDTGGTNDEQSAGTEETGNDAAANISEPAVSDGAETDAKVTTDAAEPMVGAGTVQTGIVEPEESDTTDDMIEDVEPGLEDMTSDMLELECGPGTVLQGTVCVLEQESAVEPEELDITDTMIDDMIEPGMNDATADMLEVECGPGTVLQGTVCVLDPNIEIVVEPEPVEDATPSLANTPSAKASGGSLVYGVVVAFAVAGGLGAIAGLAHRSGRRGGSQS